MNENEMNYEKMAALKSKSPPIISDFGISKLYGYRDISFSTHSSTTILIAKNGTGKTTLLGALNAFLNFELYKFKDILFEKIHCTILDQKIEVTKEDISQYLNNKNSKTAHQIKNKWGIDLEDLVDFCIRYPVNLNMSQDENRNLMENSIFQELLSAYSHNKSLVIKLIISIKEELSTPIKSIYLHFSKTRQLLAKYEVVYLPTYRRIEMPLDERKMVAPYRSRRQPAFPIQQDSIFSGDIHFGLSDISDRLSRLSQEIIIKCNNGYRDISANIINELIDGEYKTKANTNSLPTLDELKLFFTRIKLSKNRFNPRLMGPYLELNSPNLDKLYPIDDVPEESRVFLTYFLNQLGLVIETIKAVENPISGFIDVCNKYLTKNDFSAEHRSKERNNTNKNRESKKLVLNRENLSIKVYSTYTEKPIQLEYLSSGEKQMISIFSKLFLYPSNKIILIDEPEISLSINWQSRILVDIVNSDLCSQLISITHSPFVFDNTLEPFAKSLKIKVHLSETLSDDTELGGINWIDGGIDD